MPSRAPASCAPGDRAPGAAPWRTATPAAVLHGSVAFGAGRRGCPGAGFAAPTVELALANLLYHFDWAAPTAHRSGVGTPPVDVSEVYGLSVRLKTPLILVAKPWLG